jgi:hypothetical protein
VDQSVAARLDVATGNPSRFVLGDGAAGRASIDWDDLLQDTDN